jgi:hypothetical protein
MGGIPSPAHHLPDRRRVIAASPHDLAEFGYQLLPLPLLVLQALHPLRDALLGALGQGDVARSEPLPGGELKLRPVPLV